MRKSKTLLFLLLLSGFYLTAQTNDRAKKLLDQVSTKIGSFKTMTFDFDYVLENRQENIKQETNGSVTVSGDLYKLNFLGYLWEFTIVKIPLAHALKRVVMSLYRPKGTST